jgi:SSS family solute:Na+ symporter
MNPVFVIVASTIFILGGASMLSLYIGKKSNGSSWATGGRNLPLYVIVGTQYATVMGGGMLVAHIGIGYQFGWSAVTYGLFVSCGLVMLSIIANWLRKEKFTTIPDIIEKIYGKNKLLLGLTIIMTIIVPFGWLCTQLVAFGKIYSAMTGISMNALIIVFAIISLVFVLPAGLASIAWTDFLFGCLMLVMSVASLILVTKMGGGISSISANSPPELWEFPKSMGAVGGWTILLWGLAIIPGTLTNQMCYQRIFAVDNVKNARKSLIISAILILFGDIWASYMGISIKSVMPNIEPEMAASYFLSNMPLWFMAIYSGFLVATIMSTADSAVQSIVVNLTEDLYKKIINPNINDDKKIFNLSRILAVTVTTSAVALSILYPHALSWLIATYAYSASALLFPIFAGYFLQNKRFLTQKGAIGSMFCGFIGCLVAQIMNTTVPYVAFGLIASFLGLILISYFTKKLVYSNKTINLKATEQ